MQKLKGKCGYLILLLSLIFIFISNSPVFAAAPIIASTGFVDSTGKIITIAAPGAVNVEKMAFKHGWTVKSATVTGKVYKYTVT
jgi:hypothetical protein